MLNKYEIKAKLSNYLNRATDDDVLNSSRRDALNRYYAQPYGDEKAGRSQVLTTECRDTIMWLLPSVMKTFLSTDKVVEFLPASEGKEGEAEQQSDFINYVIMQENPSFQIFHNWFLDALMLKNGYVKYGYDEQEIVKIDTYTGLDMLAMQKIADDETLVLKKIEEIVEQSTDVMGNPVSTSTFDLEVERRSVKQKYYIENIQPERVIVDNNATSIDDALFVGAIYYKTRSELINMGYSRKEVEALPRSNDIDTSTMAIDRNRVNDKTELASDVDIIKVVECYVKMDINEDGKDELNRIVVAGEQIMEIEEADEIPIVPIAPFLKPHSFYGDSMVDYTKDIQRINTTLWRQILDYIYLANNPMWEVEESSITNMNDALRRTPGGLVRTRKTGSITPIVTTPLQPEAFGLLDRLKDMKDRRTGVMEINQGLDPNAINKTATGMIETMDAGKQLQDLIVRVFAETGVKRLFRGLYGLVIKHQDKARTVKLRNKWVTINPTEWDETPDVVVNVGLGTGSSRVKMAQLEQLYAKQMELMPMGIVSPQQIYNTFSKMVAVAGYKDVDSFVVNPQTLPPPPQQPAKPSIEDLALNEQQVNLQRTQIQSQTDLQEAKIKAETDRYKADLEARVDLITKGYSPNV